MYREGRGSERADACMGVNVRVVVPVVQHEGPRGDEEHEEAHADEPGHMLGVAEIPHRLGEDVEDRDADDDTAGRRDERAHLPLQPERQEAAEERREHRPARERYRDPGHAHLLQTP